MVAFDAMLLNDGEIYEWKRWDQWAIFDTALIAIVTRRLLFIRVKCLRFLTALDVKDVIEGQPK